MKAGRLGFGCMRLPVLENNEIDHEKFCEMVDLFLARGFTYFDTSYVYHGGKSEAAVREALVKRYPRDRFTIATKFPTFSITGADRDKVAHIFKKQLTNCGVSYFDYYLLHNLNQARYEQVVKPCGLFKFIQEKKAEGFIRNIGFSFHDSAEILDQILHEHPEVDFVQIVLNYFDWNSYTIQAKDCYETARKYGKQIVVMETVKVGMLAKLPQKAGSRLCEQQPAYSDASWAIRFAAGQKGVLAVLSGMSDIYQVEDNTACMQNFQPLSAEETGLLMETAQLIRRNGPVHTDDFVQFKKINRKEIPAAALLDTWTAMAVQPNPYFTAEGSYYSSLRRRCHAPEGE